MLDTFEQTRHYSLCKMARFVDASCLLHIGRGMFTPRRGHRSYLPGENGGEDRRSSTLCHVSYTSLFRRACQSRNRSNNKNKQKKTLPLPYSHKLADQKTRKTMERGDFRLLHYAGEVTYCVVGEALTMPSSQIPEKN